VLKIPNAALRFRPPESIGTPGTNAAAQIVTQNPPPGGGMGSSGGGFRQGGSGGGGGPGGLGAGGPRGGAGAGGRPRSERQLVRTVYVLPADIDPKDKTKPKPKPVQIKVGISDGISTEVLDGLEEGMQVVTGTLNGGDAASRSSGASNPFGGGPFRRF
jgi:HlyD family secretion protein